MKITTLRWIFGLMVLAAPAAMHAGAPTPNSVTIPLQLVQLPSGGYKLGIEVTLGGGTPQLYEFDTGAAGFFAANNTAWWPSYTVANPPNPIVQMYDSGITYNSQEVSTTIDLGHGLPVITANMGQIQSASGGPASNWDADVAAGIAPLYGNFFGDFGMDLGMKEGLFGILPQLPGNLSNGFIIHTGGMGGSPTLTIGLTAANRAQFTSLIPMDGGNSGDFYPNSNYPTYNQQIIKGSASFNGTSNTSFPAGFVLDTGAPLATVHDDGGTVTLPADLIDGNGDVNTGTNVTFSSGNWSLNFLAGNVSGENLVTDQSDTKGYINTGLVTYFNYDVMFDLQNQVVGFAPVPEPSTMALLFGGAAGGFVIASRRRK